MLPMTGVALPIMLAHTDIIAPAAAGLSLAGGTLVYGTMVVYAAFFHTPDDI